jgi:predicted Zn-dependent peptidase
MVYSEYNKTILSNGLTIISERISSVRSVSIGVWIKSGTRNESQKQNGLAHYLEHMLFKGTKKRSARELARSLESVGGYLNAFTGKEQTCFYAEVLDTQLSKAVDVLSDMLCHSLFSPKEFEKERQVILDEIDSVEDTPDDLVQDIFMEKLFPGHSLGYPILGTKQTISQTTHEQLLDFYRRNYTAGNMVIAAAGNMNHRKLVELCDKKFDISSHDQNQKLLPPLRLGHGEFEMHRPVNQTHICIGTPALPYNHHRKYELLILNTILGVGMGSRLFQNIRERYGIAYSIYSFVDFFRDHGLMAIYLGTEPNKKQKALNLLDREFDRLQQKIVSKTELERVKTHLKGNLLLGLENTVKRMSRIARMEIYSKKFFDIDRIIEEIDKVNQDGLFDLVHGLLNRERLLLVSFLPN